MEREYLLQKQKLHILQHSERRKEKSGEPPIDKQNPLKSTETIEKMALRERGNSLSRAPVGTIVKKH